jgi:hypothetical protein
MIIMGIGDWGLGIGDWGLGPIPNPHYKAYLFLKKYYKKYLKYILKK